VSVVDLIQILNYIEFLHERVKNSLSLFLQFYDGTVLYMMWIVKRYLRTGVNPVSIRSDLAAILNTKWLSAAVTHVRRITVSYPSVNCNVRYSGVTM